MVKSIANTLNEIISIQKDVAKWNFGLNLVS